MHTRRDFISYAAAGLVTAPAFAMGSSAKGGYSVERYRRAVVIDALGGPDGFGAASLADIKASGVTAVNLTVGEVGNSPDAYDAAIREIANIEGEIAAHPDLLMKVLSAADLRAANTSKRLGLIYGFQDTSMLAGDLSRLTLFRNLGVRIFQLTYNRRNLMADGCLEPADGGLSTLGRQAIAEINKLRVLLDLSHAGPRTIREGIEACKGPLAITHTGCRALVDVPRNTDDRSLKALADKGGVAGIYFMPFLRASGQARAEDLIRHLEHAVNVCGEDHVGLGTDGTISAAATDEAAVRAQREFFERRAQQGIAAPGEAADVFNFVPEYNEPLRLLRLAEDLGRRGWSETKIEKILGGNFLRLFAAVWGG
ncbi:dipeptidase [Steroidobacter sp.]|uniref:dipeptidase n=1 Tax=Steroidobacter sp. TaxID=1978227 RepID=UPI001A45744F|nr:membrane dipeptidase [Steroidobacter sp.]MBL8265414.1 membrane dipeptidase [Steroidobacter sp.]